MGVDPTITANVEEKEPNELAKKCRCLLSFFSLAYQESLAFMRNLFQNLNIINEDGAQMIVEEDIEKLFQTIDRKWQEETPELANTIPELDRKSMFATIFDKAIDNFDNRDE